MRQWRNADSEILIFRLRHSTDVGAFTRCNLRFIYGIITWSKTNPASRSWYSYCGSYTNELLSQETSVHDYSNNQHWICHLRSPRLSERNIGCSSERLVSLLSAYHDVVWFDVGILDQLLGFLLGE
jgi:hypothetical protein